MSITLAFGNGKELVCYVKSDVINDMISKLQNGSMPTSVQDVSNRYMMLNDVVKTVVGEHDLTKFNEELNKQYRLNDMYHEMMKKELEKLKSSWICKEINSLDIEETTAIYNSGKKIVKHNFYITGVVNEEAVTENIHQYLEGSLTDIIYLPSNVKDFDGWEYIYENAGSIWNAYLGSKNPNSFANELIKNTADLSKVNFEKNFAISHYKDEPTDINKCTIAILLSS